MSTIIQIDQMTKRFKSTVAVDALDLQVPEGSIFAFLGPNGAGKTTTIKALMNIIQPDEGHATVFGVPTTALGPAEFRQIGYVSENQKIPKWLTVQQLSDYCAPMYPNWDKDFYTKLIKQFDLPPDRKIRNLSRGMMVKAALLTSLAYRPRLLMLDEPFTGLDPLVRDEFIRGVLELTAQENWTVFVSSHDIDEVERLADWVGILNKGHLHICESVAALQGRFRQVEVVQDGPVPDFSSLPETWLVPEHAGKTMRFVDSAFDEHAETKIRGTLTGCQSLEFTPLSLREIFLTLARTYRISE